MDTEFGPPVVASSSFRTTSLCGIPLTHSIINASGTFDALAAHRAFGDVLFDRFPFSAYVTKTVTLQPRAGNPPPRLWELGAGMINSIGLPNKGLDRFLDEDLREICRLPVPIVTVVTGEGGSGGALALAVGDRVLMMENAYYSVISPEGCSTILFKDAAQAPRAAEALRLTAPHLLRLGVMDGIVPEPAGGAHQNPVEAAANLKAAIVTNLQELLGTTPEDLLERRYERFRAFGVPGRQVVLDPPGETS